MNTPTTITNTRHARRTARAVLDLIRASGVVPAAVSTVNTFERACAVFGERTARWTVASNARRTPADALIEQWAPSVPTMVIAGTPGQGKTVGCARWVAGQEGGFAVRAGDADRWPWDGGPDARRATHARALFVDDLGREDPRSRAGAMLVNIIADRHTAGRRTLVATMLTRQQAAKRFEDHFLDRLGFIPSSRGYEPGDACQWHHLHRAASLRVSHDPPDETGLESARSVMRCARALEHASDGVTELDHSTLATALALFGLDRGEVEARAQTLAQLDHETATMMSQTMDRLGGSL